MRPHRIQVSSSRCDRLEEAEELETSEEPLLRREPLIDRMDLESASSNLHEEKDYKDETIILELIISDGKDTPNTFVVEDGSSTPESDREAETSYGRQM